MMVYKNKLLLLVVALSNQKAFFGDSTTVGVRSLRTAISGVKEQMKAQRGALGIGKRTNRVLVDSLEEDSIILPNPQNQNVLYLQLYASVSRMASLVPFVQSGGSTGSYSFESRNAAISLRSIGSSLGGGSSAVRTFRKPRSMQP
jgi:hypothetical protein